LTDYEGLRISTWLKILPNSLRGGYSTTKVIFYGSEPADPHELSTDLEGQKEKSTVLRRHAMRSKKGGRRFLREGRKNGGSDRVKSKGGPESSNHRSLTGRNRGMQRLAIKGGPG